MTALQDEDEYVDNSDLKEQLAQKIKEIFPSVTKPVPLQFSEISRRLDVLQAAYLEEIDNKLYEPASEIWIDNDKNETILSVTDREWLDHEFLTILRPMLNNLKRLV